MAAVEPDFAAFRRVREQRARWQPLHPRRPFGARDALFERLRLDGQRVDRAQRRDRESRVVELVTAKQARRREIEQAALVVIDKTPVLDADMPFLRRGKQRRAHLLRGLLDHRLRFGLLLGRNHRHAALDDTGLFASNLDERIAEEFGMIHADRRDDARERRVHDVGGIESAAEADLKQNDVGNMLREQHESSGSFDLQQRDWRTVIGALTLGKRILELLIGREHARDAKPLVDAHEMRRGVDVDAQARRLTDRAQESNGRTLAVGAGNVNDRRQATLGMIQCREDAMHPRQIEIDTLGVQRREPRQQTVEIARRGCGGVHADDGTAASGGSTSTSGNRGAAA